MKALDGVLGAQAREFALWVEPHWSAMNGLAFRLAGPDDAEDVVQEAMTTAWQVRHRFDQNLGTPRAWLLALVADQARRSWRRGRRRPSLMTDPDLDLHEDTLPDVDLQQAVQALAPRQRLAVELYYYAQLPVLEVAHAMRCSEGTVKSTLADARARLRQNLEARP